MLMYKKRLANEWIDRQKVLCLCFLLDSTFFVQPCKERTPTRNMIAFEQKPREIYHFRLPQFDFAIFIPQLKLPFRPLARLPVTYSVRSESEVMKERIFVGFFSIESNRIESKPNQYHRISQRGECEPSWVTATVLVEGNKRMNSKLLWSASEWNKKREEKKSLMTFHCCRSVQLFSIPLLANVLHTTQQNDKSELKALLSRFAFWCYFFSVLLHLHLKWLQRFYLVENFIISPRSFILNLKWTFCYLSLCTFRHFRRVFFAVEPRVELKSCRKNAP